VAGKTLASDSIYSPRQREGEFTTVINWLGRASSLPQPVSVCVCVSLQEERSVCMCEDCVTETDRYIERKTEMWKENVCVCVCVECRVIDSRRQRRITGLMLSACFTLVRKAVVCLSMACVCVCGLTMCGSLPV